ncbi:hypothetical protein [Dendronalium sp. ChiSLP03b]|uniref:hypothetical protein n=1 Tax=Dendronalium sp. ChiSLP03b TaxID=3075381 RepID=UPI002AD47F1F|nr:hypothetical protein [Dendronalium sp. ChiSLP03b]MDZ8204798.1 hypothetical protein [Dendronalium sp. ChiSLP03b]
MNAADLFPTLQKLSRADKLKVMEFLVQELATEEEALSLKPEVTNHIWSHYNSYEAVHKLAALLEEDRQGNDA